MAKGKSKRALSVAPAKASASGALPGKVPVFGLLKRGGRVHALTIPDAKSLTTLGIIRHRVQPDARVARTAKGVLYNDYFR